MKRSKVERTETSGTTLKVKVEHNNKQCIQWLLSQERPTQCFLGRGVWGEHHCQGLLQRHAHLAALGPVLWGRREEEGEEGRRKGRGERRKGGGGKVEETGEVSLTMLHLPHNPRERRKLVLG